MISLKRIHFKCTYATIVIDVKFKRLFIIDNILNDTKFNFDGMDKLRCQRARQTKTKEKSYSSAQMISNAVTIHAVIQHN